ncbi:hypothetical protein [Saccharospirillum impatiens]|uniref:hypothetical protein n=1 Tax=Saccharospirillum impatiens TaxID=169438 RepID=UPI00041E4599|nr:hypothetical protein [Saccharospirillum impatiens]
MAEPYEQTQGEGYTVCEAFEPILADWSAQNPMVCEVELGDTPNGFSRPDWEELSLEEPENLALFRTLDQAAREIYRSPVNDRKRVSELSPEEWLRDFHWRQEQPDIGEPRLFKAKLGLDGEGEDETVVATTWGNEECRKAFNSGNGMISGFLSGPYTLFIYDETTGTVNLDLTDGPISGLGIQGMDPMIFQQRAFLLTMSFSSIQGAYIYLNAYYERPGRGSAVNRCRFEAEFPR